MSIPTYTPGYPPDGSSLGQTKVTIRNNLDGTFQTLAVDHINNNGQPGSKPAGYHKVIHMVPQASDPTNTVGYGQLYGKTITSVSNTQALFYQTGSGIKIQMTMNVTPSATTNGYTFLAGGILYQWGTVTSIASSGTVTFPIAFPTNCFNVQVTSSASGKAFTPNTLTTTTFNWAKTGSVATDTFYWTAIGN